MLEALIIICIALILANSLADRFKVVAPLLLIAIGVLISFIPGLPRIFIEPDIVLGVFLPLLLYWEATNISLRGIKRSRRSVMVNGTLMVIFVALLVGLAGQWVGLTLATALLIGAAVGPTDATAVAALGKGISPRQMIVLRAESLINDGTALVVFALALEYASGQGHLTAGYALWRFFISFAGGILVGLLIGWASARLGALVSSYMVANIFRLMVPLLAYFTAELFEASGVLATVVAGLYIGQVGPRFISTQSRVLGRPAWGLMTYILNSLLFLLVGLHLAETVRGLSSDTLLHALLATGVLYLAMVFARWIFGEVAALLSRLFIPAQRRQPSSLQSRWVITVAGFRGAISLAVAFSIPTLLPDGNIFPQRDIVIFATSGIVILSLLIQGALLPPAIRAANAQLDPALADKPSEDEREFMRAQKITYQAVLEAFPTLVEKTQTPDQVAERVREDWIYRFEHRTSDSELASQRQEELVAENRLRLEITQYARSIAIGLRDRGQLDDEVLFELMNYFDLEEMRLLGPLELE